MKKESLSLRFIRCTGKLAHLWQLRPHSRAILSSHRLQCLGGHLSYLGGDGGGLFIGEKDQSVVAVHHACQCVVAVPAEKLAAWNVLCSRLDTQYEETAYGFTPGPARGRPQEKAIAKGLYGDVGRVGG